MTEKQHFSVGNVITISVMVAGFIIQSAVARSKLAEIEIKVNSVELIYERKDTHTLEIADMVRQLTRIEVAVDKLNDSRFTTRR